MLIWPMQGLTPWLVRVNRINSQREETEQAVRMLVTNPIEDVQEKYNPEGAPKIKKRQVKAIHVDHRKMQKNS